MTKHKITAVLVSIVVAFGLWLYVVGNVTKETTYTIYNVPVVMEGEAALNERNLMVTSISANSVNLTLYGARS